MRGSTLGSSLFVCLFVCLFADVLFVSSHERKYLGFKLLETLLPALTASEVSVVIILFVCLFVDMLCIQTLGFPGV